MRGVSGEIQTGTIIKFNVKGNKEDFNLHQLPLHRDHLVIGKYAGWTARESRDFTVEYQDLINKCKIKLTLDQSYPKYKVFVRLPAADRLEVPTFFIEGHFRVVSVTDISGKVNINAEEINKAFLRKVKADLYEKRLFFEYMEEPIVNMEVKETPIGDMRVIVKKISGVEI